MSEPVSDREVRRRLAVLRHVEEVSGNVAQTCRYYGVSRQTYYKWLHRYEADGVDGLLTMATVELWKTTGRARRAGGRWAAWLTSPSRTPPQDR